MVAEQALRLVMMLVGVGLLGGCSECDRLTVHDGEPWIDMDCPDQDVVAVFGARDSLLTYSYSFRCRSSDEHYAGAFAPSYDNGVLKSYSASCESDGCCWRAGEGGNDCCVKFNDAEYGSCDESSETTVHYY